MPIILPHGLTSEEIRVLQEFRRLNAEHLTVETIRNIKHPAGGGEAPAVALASKGYVVSDAEGFRLTENGKSFLAIEAKPDVEETSAAGADGA